MNRGNTALASRDNNFRAHVRSQTACSDYNATFDTCMMTSVPANEVSKYFLGEQAFYSTAWVELKILLVSDDFHHNDSFNSSGSGSIVPEITSMWDLTGDTTVIVIKY